MKNNQPFHLVTPSPWPLIISISIMNNLVSIAAWFNSIKMMTILSIPCTLLCATLWWRDVTRESTFQGMHTQNVYVGLRVGMILFIISEIMFFLSFFWAYFHSSLAPSPDIGQLWPPKGIMPFNPLDIPLLNTIILVTSGISVTWAHHSMLNNNKGESKKSLMITIILGIYFTTLQTIEYKESPFTISDSIYGSSFFMATGFHGLHVIIGSMFLLVCYYRMANNHFSKQHHFGFEASAWYWHFVDVVWLFLYISIYWWSY